MKMFEVKDLHKQIIKDAKAANAIARQYGGRRLSLSKRTRRDEQGVMWRFPSHEAMVAFGEDVRNAMLPTASGFVGIRNSFYVRFTPGSLHEVQGLGKGLGSVGAKMSKMAGMPGMDVSNNTQAIQPQQNQQGAEEAPAQEEDPEAAAAQEGPEMVEKLPKPEEIQFDRMGSPDKHHLRGHTVRWGGRDYILDWDDEFEVYKIVDPETFRVKTRVKPESVSTVDYRVESIKEGIDYALNSILAGEPVDAQVDSLVRS